MEKQIFKTGDRVFSHRYGWGIITKIGDPAVGRYPITVLWDDTQYGTDAFTLDGRYLDDETEPELSFTEYKLVKEGFSQERPKVEPFIGDVVYFRTMEGGDWYIGFYQSPKAVKMSNTGIEVMVCEVQKENPLI